MQTTKSPRAAAPGLTTTGSTAPPPSRRRFLVLKRNLLRGRYPRILEVGADGIRSLDPTKGLELTNEWAWEQVIGCEAEVDGLTLSVQSKGGIFSTSGTDRIYLEGDTADIIGTILVENAQHTGRTVNWPKFDAKKLSFWKKDVRGVELVVTPQALRVNDRATGRLLSEYFLVSITKFGACRDGFYVQLTEERLHLFQTNQQKEVLDAVQRAALALRLKLLRKDVPDKGCMEALETSMNGTFAKAFLTTPHEPAWFTVSCDKLSPRYAAPRKRRLALFYSPSAIQEFEEQGTSMSRCISVRSIKSLEAITCPSDQPTTILLHFKDRKTVQYRTVNRDELACCLLDIIALSLVPIPLYTSASSLKFRVIASGPLTTDGGLIMFQSLLSSVRLLNSERSDSSNLVRAFAEFNANTSLDCFTEASPERVEMQTVAIAFANELLERPKVPLRAVAEVLQTLVRITRFSSAMLNKAELTKLGLACFKKGDEFVIRCFLQILFTLCSSLHQDAATAYANRQAVLGTPIIQGIERVLWASVNRESYMGLLRGVVSLTSIISYVLDPMLVTERDSTPVDVYDAFTHVLLNSPRSTLKLLAYCRSLPNYSQQLALIFMRLFEPSEQADKDAEDATKKALLVGPASFQKLEREALTSGYFLYVFRQALFAEIRIKRATSRAFLAMFCAASKDMLNQLVPPGLVHVLDVPQLDAVAMKAMMEDDPMEDAGFRAKMQQADRIQRVGVAPQHAALHQIRNKRNFPVFFHMIQKDHSLPDLIWNQATRNDLKLALDKELAEFTFSDKYAWNFVEFHVEYPSLASEILLGDCYVRLLLDEDEQSASKLVKQIREPLRFFHSLFHHLLRAATDEQRTDCLRALYLVQTIHNLSFGEGGFSECPTVADIVIGTMSRAVSDHAFMLLRALCEDKGNLRLLLKTPRAIEAALFNLSRIHALRPSSDSGGEPVKEWYYKVIVPGVAEDAAQSRQGPFTVEELVNTFGDDHQVVSSSIRFWASGLHKEWRAAVDIPQLKYQLLMQGRSVLSEEKVALASLEVLTMFVKATPSIDEDGRWVRPPPKAYRILTRRENVSTIANALLAHFCPAVVDGAAALLGLLGQVPELLRKLYLTGAYYFALSYRGSNFNGIADFLFATHLEQHFNEEASNSSAPLKSRSVVAEMLPEAMLHMLAKSSAKFKEVFVGADADTPDLIWTGEMRRSLVEAIEAHIQGFAAKLRENFSARFDFVPIPPVTYRRLERETYCFRYYLDNLCNRDRFPNWPVSDPVALLKAALDAWRRESNQACLLEANAQSSAKPTSAFATKVDALRALELFDEESKSEDVSTEAIKRAWRKLARQYHPDRNPAGRERFELIQAAYDQLVAPRAEYHFKHVIDPVTLSSVLDCQILVMERASSILEEFRYAGFDMLLNLLDTFASSEAAARLKSDANEARVLETACKLLFRVCWVSHHNAEELVRHVPRLAKFTMLFKQSPPHPRSCYSNLLRVIAGLAALSEAARELIGVETELLDEMCDLPRRTSDEWVQAPDAMHAVFRTGQTPLAVSGDMILRNSFLKSLAIWMLSYDPTWRPSSPDDDPMYKDELLGLAAGGVRNTLAKAAAMVVLQHKSHIQDLLFPRSLLSLLPSGDQASLDSFLTGLVLGTVETLTAVWALDSVAELKLFINSEQAVKPDYSASLGQELIVGGKFFVRVYIEQKCPSEPGFTAAVIDYVLQEEPGGYERSPHFGMALSALVMLLSSTEPHDMNEMIHAFSNPGTFKVFMDTNKDEFIADVLNRYPQTIEAAICALNDQTAGRKAAMSSSLFLALAKIERGAEYLVEKGDTYVFLLLQRFALKQDHTALKALSQCAWDVLQKEKTLAILSRWLPIGLCERISDTETFASILMSPTRFESCRLVWGPDARDELSAFLAQGDETQNLSFASLRNERVIGGVYLRVFLKDPNQEFDRPELFLEKAIEAFLAECALRLYGSGSKATTHDSEDHPKGTDLVVTEASKKDDPVLTPLVSAIVALLVTRAQLCAHISVWGNAGSLVKILLLAHPAGQEAAGSLRIMKAICSDAKCLRAFAECSTALAQHDNVHRESANFADALIGIVEKSKQEADDVAAMAMEILRQCLDAPDVEGARAIAHLLIENDALHALRLAKLLSVTASFKSKYRVHAVECLRRLEARFGTPQLSERIEQVYADWSKIRMQRHDLFISDQEERTSRVFLLKGPAEALKTEDTLLLTNSANVSRRQRQAFEEADENDLERDVAVEAAPAFEDQEEPPL